MSIWILVFALSVFLLVVMGIDVWLTEIKPRKRKRKKVNKEAAEKLLQEYRQVLFSKFKDWGDHPSQTAKIDAKLKEIEEKILFGLVIAPEVSDPLTYFPYVIISSGSK